VLSLIAFALIARQDSPQALLGRMQASVHAGNQDQVAALFEKKSDSDYLFRMASRCGGLKGLKVAVFPAPKGWESTGKYWAMFHTWQELEQDHDPIYRVVDTPQGLELGPEIPEWDCGGNVSRVNAQTVINPDSGEVVVRSVLQYANAVPGRALLFRVNDAYQVALRKARMPMHDQFSTDVPIVKTLNEKNVDTSNGSFKVGSLLAYLPAFKAGVVSFTTQAALGNGVQYSSDRDQITKDYAYITSFWIPSLGRLPAPTEITVNAPIGWVVRSEGQVESTLKVENGLQSRVFKCDVPISYPKVTAGKYVLALEGNQNGHILRSYQFAPIDAKRAGADMEWMKKAMAFYEANLGPFPFKEYDCFDGKNYYGIESYSYTILAPSITTWAVSHEMGHTYFGGLVPCAYVKDSWNEGMTQYVDDVLLHKNPEVALNALNGINVHVPLTEMPVAWEYDGMTYMRGAYAMQMLDAEIGHDNVLAGLQALIKDRVGKETTWPDLRQYFEKSSGQDLKWFWDQWIAGAVFPHVTISSALSRREGKGWMTKLTVKQNGTEKPFRLRLTFRVTGAAIVERQEVMDSGETSFEIGSDFEPKQVVITPIPTALVTVDAPVNVTSG
jgi:hypothetical protein